MRVSGVPHLLSILSLWLAKTDHMGSAQLRGPWTPQLRGPLDPSQGSPHLKVMCLPITGSLHVSGPHTPHGRGHLTGGTPHRRGPLTGGDPSHEQTAKPSKCIQGHRGSPPMRGPGVPSCEESRGPLLRVDPLLPWYLIQRGREGSLAMGVPSLEWTPTSLISHTER